MTAIEKFAKIGLKLYNKTEYGITYKLESDYVEMSIHFDFQMKNYYIHLESFIDKNEPIFVPMADRPKETKHSARYGHWQAQMDVDIDVRLHCAIHQQMIELGWIE